MTALPRIAVSLGDPGGIGPEVVVKALADDALRARARWSLVGDPDALAAAARRAGVVPFWSSAADAPVTLDAIPADAIESRPTRAGGVASFRAVERAVALARAPDPARAIVTAPVSKHAWALAGHARFPGHTEMLADAFGVPEAWMFFAAPRLRVALATVHVPLARVRELLTMGRVVGAIRAAHDGCRLLGDPRPRIAVCGLNPHAGEEGLLGDEEARVIAPAIEAARELGFDVSGPHPGDTIFNDAVRGSHDAVVAMYHDQGLIPVKLLAWDRAVNVTLGLPVIRTSPDHGTAFGLAGTNKADPGSMHAAMSLAARSAERAAPGPG